MFLNFKSDTKLILKNIFLSVFSSDFALKHKLRKIAEANALIILNFHRVDGIGVSAYQAINPDLFEKLIVWLNANFEIITFSDLGKPLMTKKNKLIISFDDGYKDFIEIVIPILSKYGIKVNQNIIPGCIDSGLPPMNVLIQDFIGQAPDSLLREIKFPGLPLGVDSSNRVKSGLIASASFKNRPIKEQKEIFKKLQIKFYRFDNFSPTCMMNINDIKEIINIHEIGTHSYEHANMYYETDDYILNDVELCLKWHEVKLRSRPKIYAFPNGSYGRGHINIVRKAGYDYVLLVENKYDEKIYNSFERFSMYGESYDELKFRSLGGFKYTFK